MKDRFILNRQQNRALGFNLWELPHEHGVSLNPCPPIHQVLETSDFHNLINDEEQTKKTQMLISLLPK